MTIEDRLELQKKRNLILGSQFDLTIDAPTIAFDPYLVARPHTMPPCKYAMLIYELVTGKPTPQQTEPLGPQQPAPVLASLPQPGFAKTATPDDAPKPPLTPEEQEQQQLQQQMAGGMPQNNFGWPPYMGAPQGGISPAGGAPQSGAPGMPDDEDPRAAGVPGNQMMRPVPPTE